MRYFAIFLVITSALSKSLGDISLLTNQNLHKHCQPENHFTPSVVDKHHIPVTILEQQHHKQHAIGPHHETHISHTNYQPVDTLLETYSHPSHRYLIKEPIITTNFYLHSAPEETEEEIDEELKDLYEQQHKHYNVLFVKAPEQSYKGAILNLAKSLKKEKTVVYVLSKKTTGADLKDALSEIPQHSSKPEVYFIKYRSPKEAIQAQQLIQNQYEGISGSTSIEKEGVAPLSSVIETFDNKHRTKQNYYKKIVQDDALKYEHYPHQTATHFNEDLLEAPDSHYLPAS